MSFLRILVLAPVLLLAAPACGQNDSASQTGDALQKRAPESVGEIKLSFAPVAKRVGPAVVNVNSTRVVNQRVSMLDFFFGEGAQPRGRQRLAQSLGSGVIVRQDGVIVTNYHVVKGAQELTVSLADRREFDAEVLLSDERTDLAVLKIDAGDETLPTLDFSMSSNLEVGDLVMAVGNPFGVGQTVTQGIVSALARTDVGLTDYSFFIQTDAAINPGNSGGALVDLNGDLVGVNTAIFSRSGGSNGIGFAIPSELVQRVVESALEDGKIVRPWLGARLQTVTPDLAAALDLSRPQGVLVSEIYEGGPADEAGLEQGDVITSVDGSEVFDEQGVRFLLATRRIGEDAAFKVIRDGGLRDVEFRAETAPEKPAKDERVVENASPLQGLKVANLSPAYADELGLDPLDEGVIVTDVARGSAADYFGFRPGDRLVSLGDTRVESTRNLDRMLQRLEGAKSWPITIERGGRQISRTFRL